MLLLKSDIKLIDTTKIALTFNTHQQTILAVSEETNGECDTAS